MVCSPDDLSSLHFLLFIWYRILIHMLLFVWSELSETEHHLLDANNRYELLGQKLGDRHSELESTQRAVRQYSEELQSLLSWMDDKEQIILPLKSLPANEQEAARKLTEHQVRIRYFDFLLKPFSGFCQIKSLVVNYIYPLPFPLSSLLKDFSPKTVTSHSCTFFFKSRTLSIIFHLRYCI